MQNRSAFDQDVFVSLSGEDDLIARQIIREIANQEITHWNYLDSALKPGELLPNNLEELIRGSRCVVAILSPKALESDYVRNEIAFAYRLNKRIFPIIVNGDANDALPFELSRLVYVNISSMDGEERADKITQFVKSIKDYLQEEDSDYAPDEYRLMGEPGMRALINVVETAASLLSSSITQSYKTRSCIFVVDPLTQQYMYMVAATYGGGNFFEDTELRFRFRRREGVIGQVWDKASSYVIDPSRYQFEDAVDYTNFAEDKTDAREEMRFMLAVPILHPHTRTVIGVLSIDHPMPLLEAIHNGGNGNINDELEQAKSLIESWLAEVVELANFAGTIIGEEVCGKRILPLSFYTYESLRQLLRTARRLPKFQQSGQFYKRNDDLRVSSTLYFRHRCSQDDDRASFYIIASSRGSKEGEMSKELEIGVDDRGIVTDPEPSGLVGLTAKVRMITVDDRPEELDERRKYLASQRNIRDPKHIEAILRFQSVLCVPIFMHWNNFEIVDAVLGITSERSLTESRLNHPGIVADAMHLTNLAGKLIASDLYWDAPSHLTTD